MKKVNYIKDLNEYISGKDLEELSKSNDYFDKIFVAKHTNTTNKVLTELSKSEDVMVRYAVLKNANINGRILRDMYKVEKDEVIKNDIFKMLKGII